VYAENRGFALAWPVLLADLLPKSAADVKLMVDALQVLAFALAIGFVISGIVSNVFGLITDNQSIFHMQVTSDVQRLAVVGLLIFAGPHVLFRAARRSLQIGDWPPAYTFTCFGLCSLWSFVVGFVVLKVFLI
jgi:fumarate reductase subunit D